MNSSASSCLYCEKGSPPYDALGILDIKFTNNKDIMRIEELYAVGPSISILIDGYIDNKSGLTSLRGTMVPAKDLNKLLR
mgnify:CR=1 FL=1